MMARNVVISEVDANMCVVLSKVEKKVTYGEFVGTTEYTGWSKKKACFSNNCNFVYFQYKKIMSTPKKPVINAVLITYINYSIMENYIGKMASFLPYTPPEPSPQSSASHLLTFLVAQLQFLREWKLSDRRLYEVFERRLLI